MADFVTSPHSESPKREKPLAPGSWPLPEHYNRPLITRPEGPDGYLIRQPYELGHGPIISSEMEAAETDAIGRTSRAGARRFDTGDTEREPLVDATAYDFRYDVRVTDDGFHIPDGLISGVPDEVQAILDLYGLGDGICWLWAMAASLSILDGQEFTSAFEDVVGAFANYGVRGSLITNAYLPEEMRIPFMQDGIAGIVHKSGGIDARLLDPKHAERTVLVLNAILEGVGIPLELSYIDTSELLLERTDLGSIEHTMLAFFAEQARLGRVVLIPMTVTESAGDSGVVRAYRHIAAVTGIYEAGKDGMRHVGVLDVEFNRHGLIPAYAVGSFFDGECWFFYSQLGDIVRFNPGSVMFVASYIERADS